jgi:hypothetical protein
MLEEVEVVLKLQQVLLVLVEMVVVELVLLV